MDPRDGHKPQPVSYKPFRSTLPPMGPSFGIGEGAALVAVERANGGELAPLLQVLWTLNSFTAPRSRPTPAAFAASTTVLIEIGVVEYVDNQLGLTPEGRKLLRRSGMPNDPRHVALVTELLQEHGEDHPGHYEAGTGADRRGRSASYERRGPHPGDRWRRRDTDHRRGRPVLLDNPRSRHAWPRRRVSLGAGSPAQRRQLRRGAARVPTVDPVACTSFPRPLVRPWTTRSQRARGPRRGLTERLLGRQLKKPRLGR